MFGSLIVREAIDPHKNLFDFDLKDHVIILNEWTQIPFETIYGPFLHDALYNTVTSILINGKGQLKNSNSLVPLENFFVQKGLRYRFRLILNGIQHCPMEFSIDEHNLTVIASDGNPIEPYEVQSIFITSGRIDQK